MVKVFYSPIQIQKLVDEVAAVGKPFLTVIQSFGGGERHTRTPTPQVCVIVLPTSTHTLAYTASHTCLPRLAGGACDGVPQPVEGLFRIYLLHLLTAELPLLYLLVV